jgi:hypothetical protein
MRKPLGFVLPLLAAAAFAATASADPGTHSRLTPVGGATGRGLVKVSPTAHDVAGPGTFDVQGTVNVHGLEPGADYTVLRWVDFDPDGICTGPAPLLLPGNPTLTTSAGGAGALHFEISKGAPLVDGVRFDVIWRVVDAAGNAVLESECLTVTVK